MGLMYLHRNKIIHRDLKSGNIFLSKHLKVKIGDFGLATKLIRKDEKRFSICGTPNYISPETLSRNGHSFEADIWALGVIIYRLKFGRAPFETKTVKETYRRIKRNNFSFPKKTDLNLKIVKLIQNLIVFEPEKRFSLEKILKSEFMNDTLIPERFPSYIFKEIPHESFIATYQNQPKVQTKKDSQ